ncbi:MAG TPA: TIGR03745 family integrating conjugative element membrane protein, partial [Lacipirellulaceae bacterium]|nr:TIGR03745 family integrating conjugative element membrane protein [Lacipirellulaceae bacterium]
GGAAPGAAPPPVAAPGGQRGAPRGLARRAAGGGPRGRAGLPAVAVISASLSPIVQAQGLPTIEDPSRGTGSGIMETLRNYGYDIVMLVALLVVASMFVGVCYHAYSTYSEIHTGRKTWGQFGLTVAIGAILLVVGIWLLTEATGVL